MINDVITIVNIIIIVNVFWITNVFMIIQVFVIINDLHDVFGDTFKDVTGDVIIKLIVRQVYHYFNFKFFEVFRIRVLVFISIYSFVQVKFFSILSR